MLYRTRIFVIAFIFCWSQLSFSQKVDLIVLGDSQTGSVWSQSYFGNFLQSCLVKEAKTLEKFLILARRATQPIHWLFNSELDWVETIQRDNKHNQLDIGVASKLPAHQKNLSAIIDYYRPKKVAFFFGDNSLSHLPKQIEKQFSDMITVIGKKGISAENCFAITPTYEMEAKIRDIPDKNLENTLKVNAAISLAVRGKCQLINGIELMKNSPLLLPNQTLKRVQIKDLRGCSGEYLNDNIHYCGEAARELANKVCDIIKKKVAN